VVMSDVRLCLPLKSALKALIVALLVWFAVWYLINAWAASQIGYLRGRLGLPVWGPPIPEEKVFRDAADSAPVVATFLGFIAGLWALPPGVLRKKPKAPQVGSVTYGHSLCW